MILRLGILILLVLILPSKAISVPNDNEGPKGHEEEKVLIVYLSRTQNTKAIAQMIHKSVGGKLIPLELVHPYPTDYRATVEQVRQENESGFLPELKTHIKDMNSYDIVFVGFPTWGMRLPPPMKTFITNYSLEGKRVIPFNTNGGYGIGSTFEQVEELCTGCFIEQGISFVGGLERDGKLLEIHGERASEIEHQIVNWLNILGFNNETY